jgi:4-hydroxy-tetrahydrodipicolinate reductase
VTKKQGNQMKIIISGYGRMGKEVEQVCLQRGHSVEAIIDNHTGWGKALPTPGKAVVIDFSLPETAVENILHCFDRHLPVVVGTTGWYNDLEAVKKACENKKGALFYAPNFSLGVNIFFYVNKVLARAMEKVDGYRARVSETHHVHKLDAPSGTAIKIAEDIVKTNPKFKSWENRDTDRPDVLPVLSVRKGEVPGIHEVLYESEADKITLQHEAKSRKGFALGAVLAAEFLYGKKGIFTMDDFMRSLGL